jgi:hypothetical protein
MNDIFALLLPPLALLLNNQIAATVFNLVLIVPTSPHGGRFIQQQPGTPRVLKRRPTANGATGTDAGKDLAERFMAISWDSNAKSVTAFSVAPHCSKGSPANCSAKEAWACSEVAR